jgi:hypothetical protein
MPAHIYPNRFTIADAAAGRGEANCALERIAFGTSLCSHIA